MISFRNDINNLVLSHALTETHEAIARNIRHLASGSRVESPGDDPTNFAIHEGLNVEQRSLQQAERNANQAVGLLDMADAGLSEVSNLIIRLRELGMAAANSDNSDEQHETFSLEAHQLVEEIDRIVKVSSWMGNSMIAGGEDLQFLVGIHGEPEDFISYPGSQINASSDALNISDINLEDASDASDALEKLDAAFNQVTQMRALVGGTQTRLEIGIDNLHSEQLGVSERSSAISDVDYAREISQYVSNQIKQSATVALIGQANLLSSQMLSLLT